MDLMSWLINLAFSGTIFWYFGDVAGEDIFLRSYDRFDHGPDKQLREFLGFGFTVGILLFISA